MRYGVDYYGSGAYSPATLHEYGWSFVIRYLSHQEGKTLTAQEAEALSKGGIDIVALFEDSANEAVVTGNDQGVQDAQFALEQAVICGMKGSRPIYFAVDVDDSADPAVIAPYFEGVTSVLGPKRTGAYGGIATIRYLYNAGLIRWGFQTEAWSYGSWDPRAQLQQYGYKNGYDLDRALTADFGQWRYGVFPPPPVNVPFEKLLPAEKDAAEKFELDMKHPHLNVVQISHLRQEIMTMVKAIWQDAHNDGNTYADWAKLNRMARYNILTGLLAEKSVHGLRKLRG